MNFSYTNVSIFHESGRFLKTQTVNILFFSEKAEFVNKIELAESNSVSTAQFEAPNTKKSAQKGKPTE